MIEYNKQIQTLISFDYRKITNMLILIMEVSDQIIKNNYNNHNLESFFVPCN